MYLIAALRDNLLVATYALLLSKLVRYCISSGILNHVDPSVSVSNLYFIMSVLIYTYVEIL